MANQKKITLLLFIFITHIINAQQLSSSEIYSQLKKLKVTASVLYIAAHPDDENNGLLPYLAKERLYRTGYLSLTRGDGGQNLIGSEQGIELGLIRTEELLAARRIDGCEQYFSRAYEFGFSKNAAEALKIWGKDKILSDVVWVIRKYEPDIIITRFPQDARAGHGHHWASAILANEAFIAAADTNRFQEQFKYGVSTWQAKRILWNTFNFGGSNTTAENQFKTDVGIFNPLLGKSYGEIGGIARSMHKSQGEGRPQRKGPIMEYFVATGGDSIRNDFMDGITTSWKRFAKGGKVDEMIDAIVQHFSFEHPEASVNDLVELYKYINTQIEPSAIQRKKLEEIQNLIINCSGLFIEAVTDNEYAVQGDRMNINFFINKRNDVNIQLKNIVLNNINSFSFDSAFNQSLPFNQNISFNKSILVPSSIPATQPYWLAAPLSDGSFTVNDQRLIGKSENDPAYTAKFIISVNGLDFMINRPVQYKYVDPVKGELYQPLVIIPSLIVALSPDNILTNILPGNPITKNKQIELKFKSNFSAKQIPVAIQLKQGEAIVYQKDTLMDFETGRTYTQQIAVSSFFKKELEHDIHATIGLNSNNKQQFFSSYLRAIKYDHIPDIHYFYTDNIKVVTDEVKVTGKKIAYIDGAGDKVPDALLQLGYQLTYLKEQDITEDNLKQYDAVVVGIRAYNIHEWLTNNNEVLNKYVEQGGNLIIQYLKSNLIGNKKIKAGPYSFTVNPGLRVTEENAKVKFLLPEHSALNYPNKITDKDFENWIQERSTYQAEQIDPHFEMPLAMNDTGEKESNSSLLVAKYGKGNIAYISLVLFRQLPAGNAGAFKLMANLISLPKHN
ncbi:MAG: PIG-L family deacetylase [Sphingobacteriia bacterium]|nr:PIG-L family deacetylase [Sphingobacteriia bacterium]